MKTGCGNFRSRRKVSPPSRLRLYVVGTALGACFIANCNPDPSEPPFERTPESPSAAGQGGDNNSHTGGTKSGGLTSTSGSGGTTSSVAGARGEDGGQPESGGRSGQGGQHAEGGQDEEGTGGRCAFEARATPYEAGMAVSSQSGLKVTLLSSAPTPRVASHTWRLAVEFEGAPVEGATVQVTPFMPDHGHGSPAAPSVSELGSGLYLADPIKFIMTGYWRTTVRVTTPEWTDSIAVPLCIE
jgi:hypothetical protein